MEYVYDYYTKNGVFPTEEEIKSRLNCFRDLIAYRIVISMPRCHLDNIEDRETEEIKYLYKIANELPEFLKKHGFSAEPAGGIKEGTSPLLDDSVRPYYRDYISDENPNGYRSLHITFHLNYEKKQEYERARRDAIPEGACIYFDEAFERGIKLQQLELSKLDVNMFKAVDNSLINDGCGLY